jgi:hypothetical protein
MSVSPTESSQSPAYVRQVACKQGLLFLFVARTYLVVQANSGSGVCRETRRLPALCCHAD